MGVSLNERERERERERECVCVCFVRVRVSIFTQAFLMARRLRVDSTERN